MRALQFRPLLAASLLFCLAAGLLPVQANGIADVIAAAARTLAAAAPSQVYAEAEHKLDAAWAALPLQMRRVLFVTEKAPFFGAYTARSNAVFRPTDKLLTYIEPVGYSFAGTTGDMVRFGVKLDFEIVAHDGTVITGQKDFLDWAAESRTRMKELMLNASISFDDGIPDGTYVLHYTLRDVNNAKIAEANLPFTIRT